MRNTIVERVKITSLSLTSEKGEREGRLRVILESDDGNTTIILSRDRKEAADVPVGQEFKVEIERR